MEIATLRKVWPILPCVKGIHRLQRRYFGMRIQVAPMGHESIERYPGLQRRPYRSSQLTVIVAPLLDDRPEPRGAEEVRPDETLARLDVAAWLAAGI